MRAVFAAVPDHNPTHILIGSLTFASNKTRKNEFLHVKCPEHISDFDHVLAYLYFYILYFSGSRRERKLLMSLFVKSS